MDPTTPYFPSLLFTFTEKTQTRIHSLSKRSLTSTISIGQPGVEFSGQHKEEVQVTQIYFIPEQVSYFNGTSEQALQNVSVFKRHVPLVTRKQIQKTIHCEQNFLTSLSVISMQRIAKLCKQDPVYFQ